MIQMLPVNPAMIAVPIKASTNAGPPASFPSDSSNIFIPIANKPKNTKKPRISIFQAYKKRATISSSP